MSKENQAVDVYHAIADPNRRVILDLLRGTERSVQEIAPHLNITMGGVSQHLQILLRSGLVVREQRGKFGIYRAKPDGLREVDEWVGQYRKFWRSRLKKLGKYLDNEHK